MSRNEAPVIMNYTLSRGDQQQPKTPIGVALKRLAPLLSDEKRLVAVAFVAMLVTNGSGLVGPVIIGHTVDTYIQGGNFTGVLTFAVILLGVYLCGLIASYYQTLSMGTVGRTVLF